VDGKVFFDSQTLCLWTPDASVSGPGLFSDRGRVRIAAQGIARPSEEAIAGRGLDGKEGEGPCRRIERPGEFALDLIPSEFDPSETQSWVSRPGCSPTPSGPCRGDERGTLAAPLAGPGSLRPQLSLA